LKNERDFRLAHLRTQQVVMIVLELRVREMVPATDKHQSKVRNLREMH
jgi:hypothetical protein